MELPIEPIEPQSLIPSFSEAGMDVNAETETADQQSSRLRIAFQVAKTSLESGVVFVEANPIPINESLRAIPFGASMAADMPPTVSGAILGISTLLIEGGAAWATADLLSSDRGSKVMDTVRSRMSRIIPENARMSPVIEAGVALVGGSAVVLAEKQREDPTRTKAENRAHGLKVSTALAGVLAVEGALIAEGIDTPSAPTIGGAVLGAGVIYAAGKWARNRLRPAQEIEHKPINDGEAPQALGLSDEDKLRVVNDPRTVFVEENGKNIPVLVPIDQLYWFNHGYLSARFGTEDIFYYAHPDIKDEQLRAAALNRVAELSEQGGVVLYDTVTSEDTIFGDLEHELQEHGAPANKTAITKSGKQRFLLQYDGNFILNADKNRPFKETTPVYDAYREAVEEGVISYDPENGPALMDVIEGDEAERLWSIYDKPFQRLADGHPINAGYDRDEFMKILRDPEMVKTIYRENGEITTLALFLNNLDHCPWLDKKYYKTKYPEAVATGNHFIFPGIVTDDMKKGGKYSIPLMQLLSKVQAYRETPCVISFECGDISAKYIPRLVRYAIRRSKVAKTKGYEKPVSQLDYYALTSGENS